ncbi:hypothetical protein PROVALCAL_02170 [Providencia alcalifaciens DSM 30120]|uniref:Uncharacterized protein n=2 Tax=Providencia alcalifaciens TaxID=126385 RepID=B6XFN8_9GAMM|nr:hypothetical protein PROVALCAL_02170 [Providencia alcalifaciens DSM 30120]EUD12522.1 hypothetical protein HMPREF1563_2523 [Providencia alcalifaciens 205/92]
MKKPAFMAGFLLQAINKILIHRDLIKIKIGERNYFTISPSFCAISQIW